MPTVTLAVTFRKETAETRAGVRLEDGANGFVRIGDIDPTGSLAQEVRVGDYLMTINGEGCVGYPEAVRMLKASTGDVTLLLARKVKKPPRRLSLASSTVTVVLKKKCASSPLGIQLEHDPHVGARIVNIDPTGPLAKTVRIGDCVVQVGDVEVLSLKQTIRMLRAAEGDVRLQIRPFVRHGRIFDKSTKSTEVQIDTGASAADAPAAIAPEAIAVAAQQGGAAAETLRSSSSSVGQPTATPHASAPAPALAPPWKPSTATCDRELPANGSGACELTEPACELTEPAGGPGVVASEGKIKSSQMTWLNRQLALLVRSPHDGHPPAHPLRTCACPGRQRCGRRTHGGAHRGGCDGRAPIRCRSATRLHDGPAPIA